MKGLIFYKESTFNIIAIYIIDGFGKCAGSDASSSIPTSKCPWGIFPLHPYSQKDKFLFQNPQTGQSPRRSSMRVANSHPTFFQVYIRLPNDINALCLWRKKKKEEKIIREIKFWSSHSHVSNNPYFPCLFPQHLNHYTYVAQQNKTRTLI
jgi:hypothetical protein